MLSTVLSGWRALLLNTFEKRREIVIQISHTRLRDSIKIKTEFPSNFEIQKSLKMESNSNMDGGFTFSQDFSQQSFGGDSTWISDSQYFSGSQSQTFEGRPIRSEAKKSKYTLPKWSRALMNQAEENQRKKDLELAVKNLVEENKQIKATLQEFLKNYPKLIQEMVKESTNYIVNNLNKSVEKCHAELIQKTSGQHQELKDQNDNQLFEVLAVITATKETLLAKSGIDPKAIMTSLDEMKELVSKQIVNKNEFKSKNQKEILAVVH